MQLWNKAWVLWRLVFRLVSGPLDWVVLVVSGVRHGVESLHYAVSVDESLLVLKLFKMPAYTNLAIEITDDINRLHSFVHKIQLFQSVQIRIIRQKISHLIPHISVKPWPRKNWRKFC